MINQPSEDSMKTISAFAASAAIAILAGYAGIASAQTPAKVSGGILTTPAGMTLYTFDHDAAGTGKSACNGPCATYWPPLEAQEGASPSADFSIVTRDDGKKQWAYKGKPLYQWSKDQKPGDKTGDGFKDMWHVAKP